MKNIQKLADLMNTDEAFQKKLKAAVDAYTGEKKEEAVFDAVLVPLAREYGIEASFEEFRNYMENLEISRDELSQVAGGDDGQQDSEGCWFIAVPGMKQSYCEMGVSMD